MGRIVDAAKRVARGAPVLMRTRYLVERASLERIGAHGVVAEEVEGAVEGIARMLRKLEAPRNVVDGTSGACSSGRKRRCAARWRCSTRRG